MIFADALKTFHWESFVVDILLVLVNCSTIASLLWVLALEMGFLSKIVKYMPCLGLGLGSSTTADVDDDNQSSTRVDEEERSRLLERENRNLKEEIELLKVKLTDKNDTAQRRSVKGSNWSPLNILGVCGASEAGEEEEWGCGPIDVQRQTLTGSTCGDFVIDSCFALDSEDFIETWAKEVSKME